MFSRCCRHFTRFLLGVVAILALPFAFYCRKCAHRDSCPLESMCIWSHWSQLFWMLSFLQPILAVVHCYLIFWGPSPWLRNNLVKWAATMRHANERPFLGCHVLELKFCVQRAVNMLEVDNDEEWFCRRTRIAQAARRESANFEWPRRHAENVRICM